MGLKRSDPQLVDGVSAPDAEPPRQRRPQPLLLVLRHAGDAQRQRPGLGQLEPPHAESADEHAVQGGLRHGELGPGQADQGRLERSGRSPVGDQPLDADARGLLPLPAALQARQHGLREDAGRPPPPPPPGAAAAKPRTRRSPAQAGRVAAEAAAPRPATPAAGRQPRPPPATPAPAKKHET